MPTGQVVDSRGAGGRDPDGWSRRARCRRSAGGRRAVDLRTVPGGVGNTTHGEGVVRGVGYAVGIKNVCFSEGFDDYSTARVRLELAGGEPAAQVHTAAAEVGQGLVTVLAQIARTELGVRARGDPARRHLDRQRRLLLRVPADLCDRRRGAGRRARRCGRSWTARAQERFACRPPAGAAASWPSCSTSRPSRR